MKVDGHADAVLAAIDEAKKRRASERERCRALATLTLVWLGAQKPDAATCAALARGGHAANAREARGSAAREPAVTDREASIAAGAAKR